VLYLYHQLLAIMSLELMQGNYAEVEATTITNANAWQREVAAAVGGMLRPPRTCTMQLT